MYHLDEIVPHKAAIRAAYDALPELNTWCSDYVHARCCLQNLLSGIDDFERFGDTGDAYFFGNDYDTELFNEFFALLSSDTNPLCIDTHNNALLYAEADSKQALAKLKELEEIYNEKHEVRYKERRVKELERQLAAARALASAERS